MLEGQDNEVIESVKKELVRVPEIKRVDVNPVSGSLVLEYIDEKMNASIVCGILLKLLDQPSTN